MYRLTTSDIVIRLADGAAVPADPANRDRQAYDAWMAAGGQPEPAPSAPPVVIEVSAFRLKLLVERKGKTALLEQKLAEAGGDALFYWRNMQVADNQQPRVKMFAPVLGLHTQDEIDAFFAEARDMDVSVIA